MTLAMICFTMPVSRGIVSDIIIDINGLTPCPGWDTYPSRRKSSIEGSPVSGTPMLL